jgi:ribosomal protein S18 acetylase RimI-like enzyme
MAAYGCRLDLSFFAIADGRIVGVCRNGFFPEDEAVIGRRDGWIINLSVARSHRRRGVASALLVSSLEAFKAAGLTHSSLGVDSENLTGAYGVYERLGYRPVRRAVVHQRTA